MDHLLGSQLTSYTALAHSTWAVSVVAAAAAANMFGNVSKFHNFLEVYTEGTTAWQQLNVRTRGNHLNIRKPLKEMFKLSNHDKHFQVLMCSICPFISLAMYRYFSLFLF